MTPEIIFVLVILVAVIAVLVTEIVPLEVLALLVLGVLAISGLVSPAEALSGFSSPAVVTIWAVFILSGGLTRTGIANILGRYLLKMSGSHPARMMFFIMIIAGVLSAFMNNVAVAALMLPVVMDLCRKTQTSPSIMLMPLAYGSLLGGLTTTIGTPPNILVSEALRANDLTPFGLFDYTPIGLIVMFSGIAFVILVGSRFLSPMDPMQGDKAEADTTLSQYRLEERLFTITLSPASSLIGRTLASSHLGSHLGLNVVGIKREENTILAPSGTERIEAGDRLIVEGHADRVAELNNWGQLLADSDSQAIDDLLRDDMTLSDYVIASDSPFIGKTVSALNFRNRHALSVIGVMRDKRLICDRIKHLRLKKNDTLILHGTDAKARQLESENPQKRPGRNAPEILESLRSEYSFRAFVVPDTSKLLGLSLSESHLGDQLDIQILVIFRKDGSMVLPQSSTRFEPGDRLIIAGIPDLIASLLLQGLRIVINEETGQNISASILKNNKIGLIEVILSPHSTLYDKTLGELRFREKYDLTVLSIWRRGRAIRTGLRDMQLQFGDALLLHGTWKQIQLLGNEPDFIVLTDDVQEVPREEKAKTALMIMAAVLLPVIFGWVPIYIAVVLGAAVMVMSKCLTMEEAYRYIEWKAVFLIAGMLPLGLALDKTGTASLVAEQTISIFGPFGPYGVLFGLLVITFVATSIVPTAALVVLMVPIALETSAGLGMSPYPLMMGIAMAASSSFTSPISHPANVLVMGPGGYKFIDYVKLGVPLTLAILAVLMVFIPIFWPFTAG